MDNQIITQIRRAQQGDQSAFTCLVSTYDKRISSIILTVVNDRQAAEDIYQDVFIKVWKKMNTFQFRSDFYTWIYRIAMNTCYNYLKSEPKKRWESIENLEKEITYDVLQGSTEHILNILYSIKLLPARQRTVVVMYYLEQNSVKLIAEILNLSTGTVKKYLFRARESLKIRMDDHGK